LKGSMRINEPAEKLPCPWRAGMAGRE